MEYSTFRGILFLSYLFIFLDLTVNVLVMAVRLQNVHELLLYVVQDTVLIFTIVIIFLLFSNTYIFQAGFLGLLVYKYKSTILCSFVYLALSIPLHVILLRKRWENIYTFVWTDTVRAFYILQRLCSVVHYYLFKRTVLRFADSRFYRNSSWFQEQMKGRE